MKDWTLLDTAAAVECLHAGHVIAYPTEAVFGLGCDPSNEGAVRKLLRLKGRHESAGLVLIASDFSQLKAWIAKVDKSLINRAMQTWPGPVTWLFPRAACVPDYVAGTHSTVAVRIDNGSIDDDGCREIHNDPPSFIRSRVESSLFSLMPSTLWVSLRRPTRRPLQPNGPHPHKRHILNGRNKNSSCEVPVTPDRW